MSAGAILGARLSAHARSEMLRRGISAELVEAVLAAPEQRWPLRPGRDVVHSRVEMGSPAKLYLLRVIVDVDRAPAEVVTAYRTSKLDKYWRREP